MKRFLVLLLVIFISGIVQKISAQDTIYKVDRTYVIAKILEVGTYDIKYKRYAAQDGPVYIIHKTDVWKIAYADGTMEYYNRRREIETDPAWSETQRPLCLSLNLFDIALSMVTISAEFNLGKSNTAIRVPLSFGLRSGQSSRNGVDGNYYNNAKLFSSGIDLIFFPNGRVNQTNYYIGMATEFGQTKRWTYTGYQPYTTTSYFENFGGVGIMNGIQIQVSKEITIGTDFTVGFQYAGNDYRPMGRIGLLMGWRIGKIGKNTSLNL